MAWDRLKERREIRKLRDRVGFADTLDHELVIAAGPGNRPGERLRAPSRSIYGTAVDGDGVRKDFIVLVGCGGSTLVGFCLGRVYEVGNTKTHAKRRREELAKQGRASLPDVGVDQVAGQVACQLRYPEVRGMLTEWLFEHAGWLFMARVCSRHPDREQQTIARAREALSTWCWLPSNEGTK